MRIAKGLLVLGMAALLPVSLRAQQQNASHSEIDLALTYTAQHGSVNGGGSFWAQGGGAELSVSAYHGLGLAANVTATRVTNINSSGVNLTLVTATFGPRYTWSHPLAAKSGASPVRQLNLFGEALIGEANGVDSVFPSAQGAQSSSNSFALRLGGGADITLTHHLAIRMVEANWLRTQLPNGSSNVQNNLQLSSGIVLHFPQ
jgi:opacity protein-like surface antigen